MYKFIVYTPPITVCQVFDFILLFLLYFSYFIRKKNTCGKLRLVEYKVEYLRWDKGFLSSRRVYAFI